MTKRVMVAAALCMFGLSMPTFASALDQSVADAIDTYARAIQAVESYDVYVSVQHVDNMKHVYSTVQPDAQGPRVMVAKPENLKPGEKQPGFDTYSRQVRDSAGKARFEDFKINSDALQQVRVFDGNLSRTLAASSKSGSVSSQDPNIEPFADQEEHYGGLYRDMFLGGGFVDLLRLRQNVRAHMDEDEGEDVLVIETAAEKGKYYPKFGFKLTLSSKHGMLPKKIETFKGSTLYAETQITSFSAVGDSVWVPTSAVRKMYRSTDGSLVRTAHIQIDETKSRWNSQLEPELFALEFPVDCKVFDANRKVVLINGVEDPKYLEVCPANGTAIERGRESPAKRIGPN